MLLVTHYYPEHKGGIEIVAGKLASQLAENGFEITWMATNEEFHSPVSGIKRIPASASNIVEKKLNIPFPLWSLQSFIELWRQVSRADIIHLHDYIYLCNTVAFLFAKIKNRPIIITQHIGFVPYDNFFFRAALAMMNRTIGTLMLRYSTKTIFISEVVRTYFTRGRKFGNQPMLIPNGVDVSVFRPCSEEIRLIERRNRNFPVDRFIFLFVGRFVEKKGLRILYRLAQANQDSLWVFAGWGPIDPEKWQLPNVIVYRNLTSKELLPLYQMSDMLVLPSKGEGFPLVVQEAMACGTPAMVGTETATAIPDVSGMLLSKDVEGADVVSKWDKKIKELIENPAVIKKMREPVARYVKQNWSWGKCAVEYEKIFKDVFLQC